jgi:2-octaprenyl-6-methoxyphenol hydroxylase
MAETLDAEVAIAGGGMVGLTLGLALAQGGLDTVVADPLTAPQATAPAFDGRVSAIAYAPARMLRTLGVWEHLAPHAQPIEDILISDAALDRPPSPFSLHFDHREIGEPLGYIVENRYIRAGLFAAAAQMPKLRLITGMGAQSVITSDAHAALRLSDGRELRAPVAIAADGRGSLLRRQMNIAVTGWDYPQTGIVATVIHERPHHGVAYEHFLPAGPFAILPMTGNRSSLVWTERREIAACMMALDEADFAQEVTRRFGDHLGETQPAGPRWSYPLNFHLAHDYVRPRFALIGDAAHGIHPIAGQGLNLGLRDAAALAETLLDLARLGLDMGALDGLKRYERWRRFDNFVMGTGMDVLNRLFSTDTAPIRLIRDLGLGITDRIAPLRRAFMRQAGGDSGLFASGRLPRLLRGEAA